MGTQGKTPNDPEVRITYFNLKLLLVEWLRVLQQSPEESGSGCSGLGVLLCVLIASILAISKTLKTSALSSSSSSKVEPLAGPHMLDSEAPLMDNLRALGPWCLTGQLQISSA